MSIIIPTCNRNDLLSKCLELLSPDIQAIGLNDYEVIVTDDSKDNKAKSLIEVNYSWAKWMEGPKKGPAANRNNGAKYAKGEWLVFVDDDCLPQNSWLNSYREAINLNKNIHVFEGCTNAERPRQRFDEEAPINTSGNKLWSCNFAISKDVFFKLNGFDENFPNAAMEDVDFYVRVTELTQILFVPGAFVIHPWRKKIPFKNFKKHLKSQRYFARKHGIKNTYSFRLERTKIWLGSIFFEFRTLIKFSMKGWPIYLERCFFNFCMIFL
ncbi:MAG: hypothetical protein JWP44_137 [Mucilaginibacter sp.]|nr:hypothetical protein [Mucilaginibacter sp.]